MTLTSREKWHDVGAVEDLAGKPVAEVVVARTRIAVTWAAGEFGALAGTCNHAGGPLGQGRLDGDYLVCPWHYWKYHRVTGRGEPGFEDDAVPRHEVRQEGGRLLVNLEPATKRSSRPHPPHALERPIAREPGPVRVVGVSATHMDVEHPRYSTSAALLEAALDRARARGAETRLLRLRDLSFRACEGYYSKSARACTWPCSITQMDAADQMEQVYEALVFWGDVLVLATPIRWGSASALYFKMTERLNCVQNQLTIRNRALIRDKVATFIITGGQDNVQAVAGQALMFFAELGFQFPPFPFIAHSRGWSAEDMERNVEHVRRSEELRQGARELVERGIDTARLLIEAAAPRERVARGGRKAHDLGGETAG
jgi:multimeric flavodoxin WrbA/nitrite reductase/ring-hydroxylating ferredoxin subunit